MARSSGRGGRTSASEAAPLSDLDLFDEAWLSRIRERFDARYIDLGSYQDRRRWHPSKLDPSYVPGPRGLRYGARIIVVPEGHRLARFQTYGGRYSLRAIQRGWAVRQRRMGHHWRPLAPHDWPYGSVRGHRLSERGPARRLGFHLPWQVIICVRRRRRREVMHAIGIAGKRGVGAGKKWRRDRFSNVRC